MCYQLILHTHFTVWQITLVSNNNFCFPTFFQGCANLIVVFWWSNQCHTLKKKWSTRLTRRSTRLVPCLLKNLVNFLIWHWQYLEKGERYLYTLWWERKVPSLFANYFFNLLFDIKFSTVKFNKIVWKFFNLKQYQPKILSCLLFLRKKRMKENVGQQIRKYELNLHVNQFYNFFFQASVSRTSW